MSNSEAKSKPKEVRLPNNFRRINLRFIYYTSADLGVFIRKQFRPFLNNFIK